MAIEPTRAEVESWPGLVVLEFGASWCGHCQAFAPALDALLIEFPGVRFVWVEDGPGRPLGRSFRVKLWPNLVFLRDGVAIEQMARPTPDEVRAGLEAICRVP